MSFCACGHDFTDHYQTDVEYLCILCSWCDGYTKAAANDSATAPVPAGGTPEGLAREKVEMTDSEVKPSSPTTCDECGRVGYRIEVGTTVLVGHRDQRIKHSFQPIDMSEELGLMRDISDRLRRVAGTMRILVAAQLLESGRASSWIEAVRMARRG